MANEFVDTTLLDGFADGPHITEKQVGLVNQGTYGPDDYVLETGRQAEAQILTNNSIRIFDAVYVIQGRRDAIAANDYTDVSIDNGAQGMNRNDIIVRRYEKDESSEIESVSYAVIKGTPNEGPAVDPAVTEGDIRSGATLHEMKLYRVKLEGLNIVAVEPLFSVLMNMSTLNAYLAELSEEELIQDGLSVCTDVHAAVSGGSPKEVTFYRVGKTINMRLNMHFSASIAQYATIFRLPSELRPKISQLFINNNGNVFSINSESGAVIAQQSIPSGTWLQISMSYLLA